MKRTRNSTTSKLVAAVTLAAVLSTTACMKWSNPTPGVSVGPLLREEGPPSRIRVWMADGRRLDLEQPRLANDTLLVGKLRSADGGKAPGDVHGSLLTSAGAASRVSLSADDGEVNVPLHEIVSVEVRKLDKRKVISLGVGLGMSALVVAIAALTADEEAPSSPSTACTGDGCLTSCPLVYSWDGSAWRLDSGTFGGAFMPALSRTDVDNLLHTRTEDGFVKLRLANELAETDHVDELTLLSVDHPRGTSVAPDGEGHLHLLGALTGPLAATYDGRSVLDRVARSDGWAWESSFRVRDTARSDELRDGVELVFTKPDSALTGRLVVDAHNTPWAAYLMQELVRLPGREVDAWYASLESDPDRAAGFAARLAREAFLSVSVLTADGWQKQGLAWEAGPEVVKRQVVPLDLSGVPGPELRVRLESVPNFWLVDHVAVDYSDFGAPRARRLAIASASPGGSLTGYLRDTEVVELLSRRDDRHLTLETGDDVELEFLAPPATEGHTRSYLLSTSGWYRIHTAGEGSPDTATLRRLETEPGSVARLAVSRMNRALVPLAAFRADGAVRAPDTGGPR